MKRDWQNVRGVPADEKAHEQAIALANTADGDFIESLVQAKAALDRFGGVVTIAAYREKIDANGDRVGEDGVGTHETLGYLFTYDHYNRTPGAPKEPNADLANPPELDIPGEFEAEVSPEPNPDSAEEPGEEPTRIPVEGGVG